MLKNNLNQKIFDALYARNLIYNACWEDPAVDRQALALSEADRVLVITSAGCNALDYVLAGAGHVDAVDANPRQNALLELKLAGIRGLEYEDFFSLFGRGWHPQFRAMYHQALAPHLSPYAAQYWRRHAHWMSGAPGLYGHGLSGLVARAFRGWLAFRPRLREALNELFAAPNLATQRKIYDTRVEPAMWNGSLDWALSRQFTMSLLGVPVSQHEEVRRQHQGGVPGFVRESLGWVFRELPARSNYFWSLYLHGAYAQDCCPEYLTSQGFTKLKAGGVERIHTTTTTVTNFLESGEQPITRFVLLDHMDWMASVNERELGREWAAILKRASQDARIIFRSAHANPGFLDTVLVPGKGADRPLRSLLQLDVERAEQLQREDRVHTYAGFHIARIA